MSVPDETIHLSLLVIDDDAKIRSTIETYLVDRGHRVFLAENGPNGLKILQRESIDIVITDVKMTGMDGFEVLQEVKRLSPGTEVIIITGFKEIENAFRAIREGAFDFFTKPLKIQDLSASLQRTLRFQALRREKDRVQAQLDRLTEPSGGLSAILGAGSAVQAVKDQIRQVSQTSTTSVLITGETGTGKELAARAIHTESDRSGGPFIAVNCSALPETLIESQFYGHEKGAFTDAKETHKGYFEQAHGGTLFLDEIGDMNPSMQTRLLRILEDLPVDVRVISATNRNVSQSISGGTFREDLFYRLNTVTLQLPPLRERPEDLISLAEHFLQHDAREIGKTLTGFSSEAIDCLQAHPFPGNIRELKNIVERAVIFSTAEQITPDDLQFHQAQPASSEVLNVSILTELNLATVEKTIIQEALRRSQGNLSQTARLLGISREMVRTRMRTHGLTVPEEPLPLPAE